MLSPLRRSDYSQVVDQMSNVYTANSLNKMEINI